MSLEAEKQLSENGNWELGIQVKYVKGKVIVISTDLYLKRGTVPFKPLSLKMLMMSFFNIKTFFDYITLYNVIVTYTLF